MIKLPPHLDNAFPLRPDVEELGSKQFLHNHLNYADYPKKPSSIPEFIMTGVRSDADILRERNSPRPTSYEEYRKRTSLANETLKSPHAYGHEDYAKVAPTYRGVSPENSGHLRKYRENMLVTPPGKREFSPGNTIRDFKEKAYSSSPMPSSGDVSKVHLPGDKYLNEIVTSDGKRHLSRDYHRKLREYQSPGHRLQSLKSWVRANPGKTLLGGAAAVSIPVASTLWNRRKQEKAGSSSFEEGFADACVKIAQETQEAPDVILEKLLGLLT